jgi:hypothetical protein
MKTFRELKEALNNLPDSELDKLIFPNFMHTNDFTPITSLQIEVTKEEFFDDGEICITKSEMESLYPGDADKELFNLRYPKGTILFTYS